VLDALSPAIIHLHNIHNDYINLPMLFRYIKKRNIKIIWTLHDCWSFTGHCPHFVYDQCKKWRTGCYQCPRYRLYPKTIFDNSSFMWRLKKRWFTGVKDMHLVTPSRWLKGLAEESYMGKYPATVIHNGINLDIFRPVQNNFREKYGIAEEKCILLGVAFSWSKKKGLDVFLELEKRLDKNKYQIVLVGTDQMVDKMLPKSVISIHRTNNQQELAEIYTAADLLVNPTREDNYPTVNMEAIACGTPVLTFCTGGSSEMLSETCGSVVRCDDVDAMEKEIIRICSEKPYSQVACTEHAKQFDQEQRFEEYIQLYKQLLKNK
jgi:glycosyltransferase involved in cell wall biosynthesis